MEHFARLFVLRLTLKDSPLKKTGRALTQQDTWRSVERLVALYGPPSMINHEWMPPPSEDEEETAHNEYDHGGGRPH